MRKEQVELTETERQKLQELVRKGKNKARVDHACPVALIERPGLG